MKFEKPSSDRIGLMADVYTVFKTNPDRREQARRIMMLFMEKYNFKYQREIRALSNNRRKNKYLERYKTQNQ